MVQAVEAARWAAVEQLQRRALAWRSGSFESATAEHAVGLVLSCDRKPDQYLSHNAYRDARKVVVARMRRSRRFEVDFNSTEHAIVPCVSLVTVVEPALLWRDLFERLRAAVSRENRLTGACLDCWRDGDGEEETADALGISLGYVKKLRRLIRNVAAELLPAAVWS